jgi:hypothetical protein
VDTIFCTIDAGYWCADNDIDEMLYNFWLHEFLRNLCGVDLSALFMDELNEGQKTLWERWNRCPMGISPSPYQAFGVALNMKRVALGAPSDPNNVFQWDRVVENLPGTASYNSLPAHTQGPMVSQANSHVGKPQG